MTPTHAQAGALPNSPLLQTRSPLAPDWSAGWVNVGAVAPGEVRTLQDGHDPSGRPIRLQVVCDAGIHPYFVVAVVNKRGQIASQARYTPIQEIAEHYFAAFVAGVTDTREVKRFVEARRLGIPFEPIRDEPEAPAPHAVSPNRLAALAKARAMKASRRPHGDTKLQERTP